VDSQGAMNVNMDEAGGRVAKNKDRVSKIQLILSTYKNHKQQEEESETQNNENAPSGDANTAY